MDSEEVSGPWKLTSAWLLTLLSQPLSLSLEPRGCWARLLAVPVERVNNLWLVSVTLRKLLNLSVAAYTPLQNGMTVSLRVKWTNTRKHFTWCLTHRKPLTALLSLLAQTLPNQRCFKMSWKRLFARVSSSCLDASKHGRWRRWQRPEAVEPNDVYRADVISEPMLLVSGWSAGCLSWVVDWCVLNGAQHWTTEQGGQGFHDPFGSIYERCLFCL